MPTHPLPATFMRGGTSNGLLIHRHDLPPNPSDWQMILSSAMGSPDPYSRQLNGMGSGISSTSKVCVVEKSARADADLDYTFVQVGIRDGSLDLAGNCGNMSSAIGPWAFNEGLLEFGGEGRREVSVRVFNTNTNKVILATFEVDGEKGVFEAEGEYGIDGVPGTGSRITLEFLDPAGAKTGKGALPTGRAVDVVKLNDGSSIEVTLSDVANPGVFVRAEDVGVAGDVNPAALEEKAGLMARLEEIRQKGAELMGLDPKTQTIPKIAMISRPTEKDDEGVNVIVRALSMQQPHKAVPLTLALNLGTASRTEGTLPAQVARGVEKGGKSVTVAHPSGKLEVGGVFGEDGAIKSALLHRTARILMKGDVYYSVKE
ncbi:hypothetical protein M409DRAFT_15989 [Zasmidium cellare ATCC 36951]|uniref:Uncharacterized protein n=1 Tax=Zasmidium cellare ATCC 36951 TaxID=1080233 RepID=A0A6A6D3T4_ZASCE|nr:uncharacterized protein M409DRAFT_15989 [Zasmidium cellare ATCC 36951]KAF2173715.1 hypothetical protein M409DRAFT_15989 [Zasmidium cellare ATCC 36951]